MVESEKGLPKFTDDEVEFAKRVLHQLRFGIGEPSIKDCTLATSLFKKIVGEDPK